MIIKSVIVESNVNRLKEWFSKYKCAIISAYRKRIKDTTDDTWIQFDGEREVGKDSDLTYAENQVRHKKLKDALLGKKYGITSQRGQFREEGSGSEKTGEKSFVVVNLNDDPNFFGELFKLSEYFNQDSFIYKPKNSDEAFYVGTNNSYDPPYSPGHGKKEKCGKFTDKVDMNCQYYSKIRGNKYIFEIGRDWRVTSKFALCEESFESASYQGKHGISDRYREFLSESTAKKIFVNNDNHKKGEISC